MSLRARTRCVSDPRRKEQSNMSTTENLNAPIATTNTETALDLGRRIHQELEACLAAPAPASLTYVAKPMSSKCRYWAKHLTQAQVQAAVLSSIDNANGIPTAYLRKAADIELYEGDWLFEGEEKSANKQRGWDYWAQRCERQADGSLKLVSHYNNATHSRTLAKLYPPAGGTEAYKAELLGTGDASAMLRTARAVLRREASAVVSPAVIEVAL